MTSLYEMDEQLKSIDWVLSENEDAETAEILEAAKVELEKNIESKMESILKYKADCDAKVVAIKSEIERLTKKIKSLNNKSDFLKSLCYSHMITTGKQKADYGTWTLSIVKKPASVKLTDDADTFLPDCYCTISRTPNKTAIKEAMTDGELFVQVGDKKIVLATLEQGDTIRIK
ncbi:MAG: siphovirus Gp157 family protein [Methanobrevibacter sp.]|nr:siphovirus Gp157 family protein [Methanobrevibacter sp.]